MSRHLTPFRNIPYSHSANPDGGYHTGKYSFDLFTHQRSTLTMPNWYVCAVAYVLNVLDAVDYRMELALSSRYPPFSEKKAKVVARLSSPSFPPRDSVLNPRGWWRKWMFALLTFGASLLWARRKGLTAH